MANKNIIIGIVQKLTEANKAPCKKTIQRIVFLIEAKGIDLGCNYGFHFYGPHSSDLDAVIRELIADGKLHVQYADRELRFSVPSSVPSIDLPENTSKVAKEVINKLATETLNLLELLTTVLYVYLHTNKQEDGIIAGVQKLTGQRYGKNEINAAIEWLRKTEYVV